MAVIVPTITTDSPEVFAQSLHAFSGFTKRVQIDVSDGSFAPTTTVPLQGMSVPEGLTVDLHLMSARPSEHLPEILALKPSLCILHAEADDDLASVFQKLKEAGIKTGVALVKTTFPGRVNELLAQVDHAMIFAGDLGRQGGAADMMQTEKVPLLKAVKSSLEIGWDGGANLSNVRAIAHAGIEVINVGSAITNADDPAEMYQALITESEKKGVLI